jgi:hypothetical protein
MRATLPTGHVHVDRLTSVEDCSLISVGTEEVKSCIIELVLL